MRQNTKLALVGIVALVVGLIAGGAMGQRQGWGMGQTFMRQELEGMLNIHVDVADAIRRGDTERALKVLDQVIASAKATKAGMQ